MTKISIQDDCLSPENYITLTYNGLAPFNAYPVIATFMREIWEVEAKDYYEREFRWDNTCEPKTFFIKAFVVRSLDQFTSVTIEVVIDGVQPSDFSKPGKVSIKMGGVLETKFGGSGILQDARNPLYQSFVWLYNHFFYKKQRRQYLEFWCKRRLDRLKARYQNLLNMTPPEE